MSRHSRIVRLFTLLLAAIQIAVPAAVSVIDGGIARSDRDTAPHIEALGGNGCAPVHTENCALCQLIEATAMVAQSPLPLPITTDAVQSTDVTVTRYHSSVSHGFRSRAPPTLQS